MQKYSAYNDRMEPDENGDCYLVSEADARIAELEHQLDIRKSAIDAQFRLMERVKALEKALRSLATTPAVLQALGRNHTPECPCTLCIARSLVL